MLDTILCGRDGGSLFGRTRVSDRYKLISTAGASQPGAVAVVRHRHSLDQDSYRVGGWLGDEWEILEIRREELVVMGATCALEERLPMDHLIGAQGSSPQPAEPADRGPETLAERNSRKVRERDFGFRVATHPLESGGRVDQFNDGTVEYYSDRDQNEAAVTYLLIDGQYITFMPDGRRIGTELSRETLEQALGVSLR